MPRLRRWILRRIECGNDLASLPRAMAIYGAAAACPTSGARKFFVSFSRPLRAGLTYAAPPALDFAGASDAEPIWLPCRARDSRAKTYRATKHARGPRNARAVERV